MAGFLNSIMDIAINHLNVLSPYIVLVAMVAHHEPNQNKSKAMVEEIEENLPLSKD